MSWVAAVSVPSCHAGRDGIHRSGANMTAHRLPRIALLAAPETSASVLYGLYDVLLSVGPMWPDMTAAESGDAPARRPDRRRDGRAVPLLRRHPRRAARGRRGCRRVRRGRRVRHVHADRHAAARPVRGGDRRGFAAMHERGALLATVCTGLAAARRGRPARRAVLRRALGVRGPLRLVLPAVRFKAGRDPRPLERARLASSPPAA